MVWISLQPLFPRITGFAVHAGLTSPFPVNPEPRAGVPRLSAAPGTADQPVHTWVPQQRGPSSERSYLTPTATRDLSLSKADV